jgi:hypothetical protein
MANKNNIIEDGKIFKIREDGTIVRANETEKQVHKKSKTPWIIGICVLFAAVIGAFFLYNQNKRAISKAISGIIAQRQIEDGYNFIRVYWSFYDKGKVAISESRIIDERFSIHLLEIPQNDLQKPSSFFESQNIRTSNDNVRIGQAVFFAYSSISGEYSGDLYPQGEGGTGYYIYAEEEIKIIGNSKNGNIDLYLLKGWNSVVVDNKGNMTTRAIPFDWKWDS